MTTDEFRRLERGQVVDYRSYMTVPGQEPLEAWLRAITAYVDHYQCVIAIRYPNGEVQLAVHFTQSDALRLPCKD